MQRARERRYICTERGDVALPQIQIITSYRRGTMGRRPLLLWKKINTRREVSGRNMIPYHGLDDTGCYVAFRMGTLAKYTRQRKSTEKHTQHEARDIKRAYAEVKGALDRLAPYPRHYHSRSVLGLN